MPAIARVLRRPRADRRDLVAVALLFALLLGAAPRAGAQAGADTLHLFWTAPGDDGTNGIASLYEIRWSTSPITALNFGQATAVPTLPPPGAAGHAEHLVVRGLTRGTDYWFALRTRDEAGNWSALSNVLRWQWANDRSPPAAPQNVVGEVTPNGKEVHLAWRAAAEPDLAGHNVYRADAIGAPYLRQNPELVTETGYVDERLPEGAGDLWYQVSSVDRDGNESARTAPVRIARDVAAATRSWRMQPPFPNPARVGETQRLPLELPRGAGIAVIEILDAAGQRVRVLSRPLAGPGFGELAWDGRNDAGALVAPGIYRAWLAADGQRQFTKLVRVP